MKQLLSILFCFAFMISYGQDEQVIIKTPQKPEATPTKVFYSQKVINTKSVEVVKKGVTEFSVAHSFGDIAGDNGGVKRFFGFDNASDIRIGFQTGLSNKLNLVTARTRGGSAILAEWELGLKYQFLKQLDGDPKHPVSLTMYVNDVMSTQKRSTLADQENSFAGFGDRHSQIVQLMLARKFGKVSFQLNPIYLHTDYVVSIDKENMFAIGGAIRLPLSKKIFFLADYFHPFRSSTTKESFAARGTKFYDPLGVGLEIVTEGHVFHLNFTNSADIIENRFIRHTVTNWGNGQFRWAFNLSRNFILFKPKGGKGGWG